MKNVNFIVGRFIKDKVRESVWDDIWKPIKNGKGVIIWHEVWTHIRHEINLQIRR